MRCSWAPLPECAHRGQRGLAMHANPTFAAAGVENPMFQASENVADAIAVEMPLAPPHPAERDGGKMKKFVGHQRLQFAQVGAVLACACVRSSGHTGVKRILLLAPVVRQV